MMRKLFGIGGLLVLLKVGGTAIAQDVADMKGIRLPSVGDDLIDGNSQHTPKGTAPIAGGDGALHKDATPFVFHFDGQDGHTIWGTHSSGDVVEKLVGSTS